MKIIAVGLGGVFGSIARFYVSKYISLRTANSRIPIGTLVVNTLGSFLLSAIVFGGSTGDAADTELRMFFTIGFFGSFTTFSTFIYEDLALARHGEIRNAALYLLLSMVLGISGAAAGYYSIISVTGG
ncbi:MAG: hypothetical protein HPY66_2363 [Firmicutes bacterium]|nr:hypothetical protein [Bacillota bacterium]MDI6705749.1 fluoride efflux transporter CrcB [Bacillota bacterium]